MLNKPEADFTGWTDGKKLLARIAELARDLIGADGATVVLRDGDHCYYADENAISALWKGRRFPMSALHQRLGDAEQDAGCDTGHLLRHHGSPTDAYRSTFVKSLAMVPVRRLAPVAAIGNYWASRHEASKQEVGALQVLADAVASALEDEKLYAEFRAQIIPS